MGRVAVAAIVALCTIPISLMVNRIVPEPYMDEIFHVPQAQQYCQRNFRSWDPMITTPPGLYFISLAYAASVFPVFFYVQAVSSFSELCSTPVLRFTNCVLAVTCGILIYEIMILLKPSVCEAKATFHAVVLSMYPLNWFFTFLYYTDVASLTAVLAMYLLILKKKYLFSSLLGAFSVFIRQTNIIWVLFTACAGVIEFTESHVAHRPEQVDIYPSKVDNNSSSETRGASHSKLRRRRSKHDNNNQYNFTSENSASMIPSSGLLDDLQSVIVVSWNHFSELSISFAPFLILLVAFIAFVLFNGGIVLGAKEAHEVSPHFPQLLYFGLVSTLFIFPEHFSFSQAIALFHQFYKNKSLSFFQWFIMLMFGFISVRFFSMAHPYLLADNRHYTFYIWRRIINLNPIMKYIMVPLYVYSWFYIIFTLGKNQKKLWVLAYCFACAASLVPAPLIEFRYYTIPFFFLALHSDITHRNWLLIGILYLSINCFTLFMFLCRPFSWNHELGIQRFIW